MGNNVNEGTDYSNVNHEETQYLMDYARASIRLNEGLKVSKHPYERGMDLLKAAIDFYAAEWCGVFEYSPKDFKWSLYWWYSRTQGEMAGTRLLKKEGDVQYPSWEKYWNEMQDVVISDIEAYNLPEFQNEYQLYKMLNAKNILAIPYNDQVCGFIILKNPARYLDRPDFLRVVINYIVNFMIEQNMINVLPMPEDKLDEDLEQELEPNEMMVQMLGSAVIRIGNHSFTEISLQNKHAWPIFCYLLLNRGTCVPIRGMIDMMFPEYDYFALEDNLRNAINRFNKKIEKEIGPIPVIKCIRNVGYYINEDFVIRTDYEILMERALIAANVKYESGRIQVLRDIVNIYRGGLYLSHSNESWVYSNSAKYHAIYTKAMDELLYLLYKTGDFNNLSSYAAKAVENDPEEMKYKAWFFIAMKKSGDNKVAKNIKDGVRSTYGEKGLIEFNEMVVKRMKES